MHLGAKGCNVPTARLLLHHYGAEIKWVNLYVTLVVCTLSYMALKDHLQ